MRWLWAVIATLAIAAGFGAWRTHDFVRPPPAIVAIPKPAGAFKIGEAAARLSQAIQQKTIAGRDGEPLDPAAFTRLAEWLAATYPHFHAAALRETIGDYSLLYTWKGSDAALPPILISAHLDSGDGGAGAGSVKSDVIYGRGAQTGKAPLIALFEAADALAGGGFKPRRTILLALGQDEEVGGHKGAATIAAVLKQRGVKAWFALGEGQPMTTNYPLTGRAVALIGVAEEQELQLRVVAAAAPGGQAVTVLARAIIALETVPTPGGVADEPANSTMRALAPFMSPVTAFMIANAPAFAPIVKWRLRDSPFGQDAMTSTLRPTGLAGDERDDRTGSAAAFVRVRLHPFDTPAAFLQRVRDVLSVYPTVSANWQTPPAAAFRISSSQSPAYRLIAAAARHSAGGAPAAPTLYPGPTALRQYSGVAQDLYTLTPALWTDDEARAAMTTEERLSFANLSRMIGFYMVLFSLAAG